MTRQKKNNNRIMQKTIRRWHRWVGYSSILLVFILSITGLILNRTEKLGLTQITVKNSLVTALYGMTPTEEPVYFKAGDSWLAWLEGRLYLDGILIDQNTDRLIGGTFADGLVLVAASNSLTLYQPDGTLVERLDSTSLPGSITAIGPSENGLAQIETPGGNFTSPDDYMSWTPVPSGLIHGSKAQKAPKQITEKIMLDFQGQGVPLSRLILDLHSGHILGSWGPYLMDLAAISLIFLGLTGLMKHRRRDRDSQKRK
ncbi:hypothetical protein MNBD_ALPHA02-1457 [hydrothermal vent metagenome]|uniref:PepSY domain-containing protein n=1 Tax=hydrothermal vent metagenome TaxID=652676 RepID=A0A3B0SEJ5_9ZZZZ